MVECAPDLDLVFHALAGSARRTILSELKHKGRSITDIASRFDMSLAAVSKHVRVLERAGLVTRSREGRVHRMQLRAAPLAEAVSWIEGYRAFWDTRFDALAALVEPRATDPRKGRA